MSDYNNVEEALDAVLLNEITELESTDSGTDEHADTVNAISALYKARNEQQRIEADYAIAQENQAIERDKIEADSKNKANQTKTDMLGHVVKAAGTVLAIGANTAWMQNNIMIVCSLKTKRLRVRNGSLLFIFFSQFLQPLL